MLSWIKDINISDMSNRDLMKVGAVGLVGVTAVYGIYTQVCKSRRKLDVPNFEKNKIYLCCFPRSREGVINLSPFALKLEAWLRMNKLDYEYVPTMQSSSLGQFPCVEYNGEEIPDSNLIIEELSSRLNIDPDKALTLEQKGAARALTHLCEFSLVQSYALYRYVYNLDEMMEILKSSFPQYKLWLSLPWSKYSFRRNVLARMKVSGYGRFSREQAHKKGCQDIKAISNYLGGKKFMMGDNMTSVDCWVFGHLAQVMYVPMQTNPQRDCVKDHASNVEEYVTRVKTTLFPDWDRLLKAAAQGDSLTKA